jgi:hypothetical protein
MVAGMIEVARMAVAGMIWVAMVAEVIVIAAVASEVVVAGVVTARVVVVGVPVDPGGMAGDQDPGEGAVAGQAPAGLRGQRAGVGDITAEGVRAAEQAVEVDGDGELGPDPTGVG